MARLNLSLRFALVVGLKFVTATTSDSHGDFLAGKPDLGVFAIKCITSLYCKTLIETTSIMLVTEAFMD